MISPIIKTRLEAKLKHQIRYPSDCFALAVDIEKTTGERLGVTTIKRVLGFVEDNASHRMATLDIIARYLGYENYDYLMDSFNSETSSGFTAATMISQESIEIGQRIRLEYRPSKALEIEKTADSTFKVLNLQGCSLKQGDSLIISTIVKDYPLYISDVIRDGNSLGSYVCGKVSGITGIKLF